jgi:signal peptidase I
LVTFALGLLAILFSPVVIRLQDAGAREGTTDVVIQSLLLSFAYIFISWLIIKLSFQTSLLRAIAVWAISLVAGLVGLVEVFGIIKPHLFEGFIVPTNAMAPAVWGWHEVSVCPECHGVLIVPTQPPGERRDLGFQPHEVAICSSCLKTSSVKTGGSPVQAPDRILVNKLLSPQRWDIIVFRFPHDPTVKYVKRLVGLPGETVYIKEGALWVNGAQSHPPPELVGLRYVTGAEKIGLGDLGTLDKPWRLGQDEYWVLGDFSERSSDSRSWGPVPGANIEGVVSLCYWPLSHWRVFR